jgi:hypothetical protein
MQVLAIIVGSYLTVIGTAVAWLILRRIDGFATRVDRLTDHMSALAVQVATLPTRAEFERLQDQVTAVRSDITQLALALGARPQTG